MTDSVKSAVRRLWKRWGRAAGDIRFLNRAQRAARVAACALLSCSHGGINRQLKNPIQATPSGDDFVDYVAGYIREAEIATAIAICQLRMVQAQEMKGRGVEVVDVDRVLG